MRAFAISSCVFLLASATDASLAGRGAELLAPGSGAFLPRPEEDAFRSNEEGSRHPQELILRRNLTSWLPEEWSASIQGLAQHFNLHVLLVPVLIGFAVLILLVSSMMMANSHWKSKREEPPMSPDESPSPAGASSSGAPPTLHKWSVPGIVALTSYRFYTGFLSATWMPYLLAMEGQQLMGKRQSVFMGSAKLIYGLSILMNPMFGLIGDQMAVISHWSGRRLFVLAGVGASGLGIYGCVVAAQIHGVWWYLAATVLWMLGEALADVTTETLVPELLPRSQYEISSAIRALNFLLGGLAGYAALILFRNFHYSWVYYGYLVVMLVCAFLTLCFINTDDLNVSKPKSSRKEMSLSSLLTQAYYMPARLEGGFPLACVCLFVFSLGSAPMFFLLLMVRDVVGVKEHVSLQMHFSFISIVFFVAAAVASVLGVATGGGSSSSEEERAAEAHGLQAAGPEAGAGILPSAQEEEAQRAKVREGMVSRWRYMVLSTVLFGVVCFVIPLCGLLPTLTSREVLFYITAIFFGMSFGSVYARFQECTWSLLPTGVDVANAMGFAAMCKLAGVGIGNFFVGFILDMFAEEEGKAYSLGGYFVMCLFCCTVVLTSAKLAHDVSKVALATHDRGGAHVD